LPRHFYDSTSLLPNITFIEELKPNAILNHHFIGIRISG